MKHFTVTTSKGITFNVRVVEQGDRYGLDDCLTHKDRVPLVEFWDAAMANKPGLGGLGGFGPLGQFVSRYEALTLADHPSGTGLMLQGNVPEWAVDAKTLEGVIIRVLWNMACPILDRMARSAP